MPSLAPREEIPAGAGSTGKRNEGLIGRILPGKAAHRVFVAAVLGVTVLIRILLVERGGQHFFYDEAKFITSREAAALLSDGHVKDALVYAIQPHVNSYADHIGFKLFGIAPEVLENHFAPGDDRIPAYFFSAFSAACVLLLAAIAYRLSGSLRAFDLTLIAAALSATLLIYSRFLVPYDLSLCFALLAIWVGVKKPAGYLRSAGVGALASWAFFCYYGYWQIAGIAVLLHCLWLAGAPAAFVKRIAASGLGAAGVVLAFLALSRMGSGTLVADMVEITKYQAVGAVDFRSGLNTWAYLFYAERLALFIWIVPFAWAIGFQFRGKTSGFRALTPVTLVATGFFALYAIFVVDSDLRHHLVVHGRHSRQLVPFLILGFGLGLDRLCEKARHGLVLAAGAAVALTVNACVIFLAPLAQEFPRDFKVRAEKMLKDRPTISDGSSYYRLVNVDHFIFEPEILRSEPLETLLASPHPLQYLPFLYEGESREMKNLRRSIDHRMRLVWMAVPDNERIRGDPYGVVTMTLKFPAGRAGYSEPLLAVGPRGNGDLYFVNFKTPTEASLGFESIGGTVLESATFDYAPGTLRVLRLFSGSLMPGDERAIADNDPAVEAIFRQKIYATLDGQVLFDQPVACHLAQPGEVYAGVNTVEADSAGAQFSGAILSVTRGGRPPRPAEIGASDKYGPIHLRIAAPPASNGTAEPLIAAGIPGRAALCYMRIFPDSSIVLGLEIWGVGIFETKPLHRDPTKPVEVEYSFGSLFPAAGAPEWGGLTRATEDHLKHSIKITVDGTVALDLERDTPDLDSLPVYYGKNPIGGSVVNAGFSGKVLLSYRAPFGP